MVIQGDKTLLVMFGAPWCSHCKTLAVRRFAIVSSLSPC